eukprot:GILJ01008862.1.p1 GENE.GILJ01008862.1~~GILJ01008862.1.p1  ORF type:complete len:198 (-),score=25.83 GILJ01008862.1:157-750(-)
MATTMNPAIRVYSPSGELIKPTCPTTPLEKSRNNSHTMTPVVNHLSVPPVRQVLIEKARYPDSNSREFSPQHQRPPVSCQLGGKDEETVCSESKGFEQSAREFKSKWTPSSVSSSGLSDHSSVLLVPPERVQASPLVEPSSVLLVAPEQIVPSPLKTNPSVLLVPPERVPIESSAVKDHSDVLLVPPERIGENRSRP